MRARELPILAQRLGEAKALAGVSDSEIALACGRERKSVMGWRHGTSVPDAVSVKRMCALFGVSADWLLGIGCDDGSGAATLFERAQDGDDQSIDMAFQAVEIASRFYSTGVAEAVSERWLWGAGWKSVAHMLGCTRQTAFEKCMRCFEWMDGNIEFADGGARYVGAGKTEG